MVDGVTDSTVTLSWMTSPEPNGVVTEYEINYNRAGSSLIATNRFTGLIGTITGLTSNTAYEFRIAAITIGLGPFTTVRLTQRTG